MHCAQHHPAMRVPILGPHEGQLIYVSLVVYSKLDSGRRQKLSLIYHLVSNQKLHVSCSLLILGPVVVVVLCLDHCYSPLLVQYTHPPVSTAFAPESSSL